LKFVTRYLVPRLIQYCLVVFVGLTVVFFVPRLMPSDPVLQTLYVITAQSGSINPEAAEEMANTMRGLYGLEAGLLEQYGLFWKRLFTGDFGPSFFMFPTPVTQLIGKHLLWTIGLLVTTTVLSWVIGNILGGLTAYFSRFRLLKVFDTLAMFIRPIPYYIMALVLIIAFGYLVPIFPIRGGFPIGVRIAFTWRTIWLILKHGFLPALSLTLLGSAVWHQMMRLVAQGVKDEDYVQYAKIASIKERIIFRRYVMRNAMLPQITGLTIALGEIFSGALIVEIVFSYPGIGHLLFRAILGGDYNLIMGIATISIVAIATGVLIIDLLYPLFDPRIRYR